MLTKKLPGAKLYHWGRGDPRLLLASAIGQPACHVCVSAAPAWYTHVPRTPSSVLYARVISKDDSREWQWHGASRVSPRLAQGKSAIECPSPPNVLNDTYDHSYY
jgi:hypothetical protein